MSGIFNRLKSRKTGSPASANNSHNIAHESEPAVQACTFDEEGFLCPICHQKFNDHTQLAQHYTDTHAQEPVVEKPTTNGHEMITKRDEIEGDDVIPDVILWKQQCIASEESRMLISNELIQQKQRSDDLEEELQILKKHLKSAQNKVVEQSEEIASLKATKDVYDSQLAMFTNELLNTKDELKAKQNQIATLCNDLIPRSTTDDVNVLKRELVTVQQCMNEMALEKEQQIERLRTILIENDKSVQRFEQVETCLNQNLSIYDELVKANTILIEKDINQMKRSVQSIREQKTKLQRTTKHMQNDLSQQTQINIKLTNDLQAEQRQAASYQRQIETLNNEIQILEKNLNDLQEEKKQFIQTQMNGDEDQERQNLVRQITQQKDQYEQQTKDLRVQIKQISNQRHQVQDELDQISQQLALINNEKTQLQNERIRDKNEIDSLRKQMMDNNSDKIQQIDELKKQLSTLSERTAHTENSLQKANEFNAGQKQDIERLKAELVDQVNRFEQEKRGLQQAFDQQVRTTISQLRDQLDQKTAYIQRLSNRIRRCLDFAHRTQEYFGTKISTNQTNLLEAIEQAKQESRSVRAQTLEQIREEFTHYLTVYHTLFTESQTQIEKDKLKLIEQQQQFEKQVSQLKYEHEKSMEVHHDKKQKLEIQLGELNRQVLQVSESLSEATRTVDIQREKYEKQIKTLERELESRTKRHEMQLSALTENLATVRTELRATNEKVAILEQIKAEKADTDARLAVSQEERRVLLERSLASESKYEKLLFENGQLTKKNIDLDAALQEIAREFQVVQIQNNKFNQRRWLNDDDVHSCMKCNQTFSVTQRKHHCRSCGNIFCDSCSSKTAIVAASSKKPQRVCDQCYKDLTS
ncbi:unnamed protein product [Adineta ricciae]|uniref:Early endosome antigen 1 n=1 Tax=Adineta ricciae TaxID=249248 RepID=A0A814X7Z7_ADIRI|nr:unnamed protein product [Adineta ricciae]